MSKKYYGNKEVITATEIGDDKVEILIDGEKVLLSKKMFSEVLTDAPVDATELRNKRCFPVVAEILKTFLDYNINVAEVDFITSRVIMSINESCKVANEVLWGKTSDKQTFDDINKVLLNRPEVKTEVKPEEGETKVDGEHTV